MALVHPIAFLNLLVQIMRILFELSLNYIRPDYIRCKENIVLWSASQNNR